MLKFCLGGVHRACPTATSSWRTRCWRCSRAIAAPCSSCAVRPHAQHACTAAYQSLSAAAVESGMPSVMSMDNDA